MHVRQRGAPSPLARPCPINRGVGSHPSASRQVRIEVCDARPKLTRTGRIRLRSACRGLDRRVRWRWLEPLASMLERPPNSNSVYEQWDPRNQ